MRTEYQRPSLRVLESGDRAELLLNPSRGAGDQRFGPEELERDLAAFHLVEDEVHRADAAGAELAHDRIAAGDDRRLSVRRWACAQEARLSSRGPCT
jgi:hypothetical protein